MGHHSIVEIEVGSHSCSTEHTKSDCTQPHLQKSHMGDGGQNLCDAVMVFRLLVYFKIGKGWGGASVVRDQREQRQSHGKHQRPQTLPTDVLGFPRTDPSLFSPHPPAPRKLLG